MTDTISEEGVKLAYAMMLGPEPENDKVVQMHRKHGTIAQFRKVMM